MEWFIRPLHDFCELLALCSSFSTCLTCGLCDKYEVCSLHDFCEILCCSRISSSSSAPQPNFSICLQCICSFATFLTKTGVNVIKVQKEMLALWLEPVKKGFGDTPIWWNRLLFYSFTNFKWVNGKFWRKKCLFWTILSRLSTDPKIGWRCAGSI